MLSQLRNRVSCGEIAWLLALVFAAGCGQSNTAIPPRPPRPTANGVAQNSAAPLPAPNQTDEAKPWHMAPAEMTKLDLATLPIAEDASVLPGVPDYVRFTVPGAATDMVMWPDGAKVAVKDNKGPIYLFDAKTGTELGQLADDATWARLALSPDPNLLASADTMGVKLWNVEQRKLLVNLGDHRPYVTTVAFSPKGDLLVTGSGNPWETLYPGTIRLWDVASRQLRREIKPAAGRVHDCAFSPDGKYLVAAIDASQTQKRDGMRGEVKVWSMADSAWLQSIPNRFGGSYALAFSPDGLELAVSEENGPHPTRVCNRITLLDTATWQPRGALIGHDSAIESIGYSPDGKYILSLDGNRSLRIWDRAARAELMGTTFLAVEKGQFTFSDDGRRCAVVAGRPAVFGLEALRRDSPRVRGDYPLGPNRHQTSGYAIEAVAFSGDGTQLGVSANYGLVRLCDLATGKGEERFNDRWGGPVRAFSADLKRVVIADKRISVWDLESGTRLHEFDGSPLGTLAVTLSADGELLATCHADSTIKVFHLPTGKLWASTVQLDSTPGHLAFAPDGQQLLAGTMGPGKGTAVVWKLPDERPAADATNAEEEGEFNPSPMADAPTPAEAPANTEAAAPPKTLGDAQLAQAYLKARDLLVADAAGSDEFYDALQSVADKIPTIEVSQAGEAPAWQTVTINRERARFACLRFKSQLNRPADFYWAFIYPQPLARWFMIPVKGRMQGFDEFRQEHNLDLPGVGEKSSIVFQSLHAGHIKPGEEYMLWFALNTREPVELKLMLRLLPTDNIYQRFDAATIAERLGLPLPLKFHKQPSLPLVRVRTLEHGTVLWDIEWSPNGALLATGGIDDRVRVWDAATGDLKHDVSGRIAAFSPRGDLMATCAALDDPTTVMLWNLADGAKVQRLRGGHPRLVQRLAFHPDGRLLASGCRGGLVTVWDTTTGKSTWPPEPECGLPDDDYRRFDYGQGPLLSAATSRTSMMYAIGGRSANTLQCFLDAEHVYATIGGGVPPLAMAITSDGGQAAVPVAFRDILIGSTIDAPTYRLSGHQAAITALAFSPDDKRLASGSADRTLRVWDIAGSRELCKIAHEGEVHCVAFTLDGTDVLSGDATGTVRLWDALSGNERMRFAGHEGAVTSAAFSPDGKLLLTGGDDGQARLWNADTGGLLRALEHPASVGAVAFSPDGQYAVTGGADGIVRLWHTETGEEARRLVTSQGPLRFVGYSYDGRFLLSAGLHDSALWAWSIARSFELAAER